MIFAIVFVCLTVLAVTAGCLYEMEVTNKREYELEKLKIEKGYFEHE